MPEGDTVFRTCARLHEALAGRVLVAAELRWPGLSTSNLVGHTTIEVVPRGKHILQRLDSGWTLHSHLKMEGQWRISRTDKDPTALAARGRVDQRRRERLDRGGRGSDDIRALLVTQEWTATGLRLGMLDLVRTSQEDTIVGHLGPDILSPDFDQQQAIANLSGPVGAALLDQRNLAGIGTMWASESLFLQGIFPWAEAAALDPATLNGVVARARRLMTANLPHAVQTSTGIRREGGNTYVHARSGRPCRRCGTTIRVAQIGPPTRERAMFYCPTCQGGLAPGDDGRPLRPLGSR
ncbi:MAG TPA: DNA-formamidopyrimidine glycosylase family protein [Propionicimonas sp.]|uniref:DNA-formamidopyrimidine glycosylase family protein n=1 Tax=Propionicimonas sp. TaxID=1955623 RepID=UPI002F4288B0